jgi:predicted phage tail protein
MKIKACFSIYAVVALVFALAACGDFFGSEFGEGQSQGGVSEPPGVPANVAAEALSSSRVRVTWGAVTGATSYRVWRFIQGVDVFPIVHGQTEGPQLEYICTGLQPDTAYMFFVSAANAAGESGRSLNPASAKTHVVIPGVPSDVEATALSSTSIQIIWEEVTGATGYIVSVSSSLNGIRTQAGTPNSNSFTHTGLNPSTTYWYFIRAVNDDGTSGFTEGVSATTQAPPASPPVAPTGLTGVHAGSGTFNLQWNPVTGASSYEVYHARIGTSTTAPNESFRTLVRTVTTTSASYTAPAWGSGWRHWFWVRAVNSAGESPWSASWSISLW